MGNSRPMTWDELVGEIRNLKQQLNAANEAKELAEAGLAEAVGALKEFVDRCERGEVRSRYTYGKFKEILQSHAQRGGVKGDG